MAIEDCFPDLWSDPVQFALDRGIADIDDATAALEEASYILWQLTGQRFSNHYIARTDTYRHRPVPNFTLQFGPVDRIYSAELVSPTTNIQTPISWVNLRGGVVGLSASGNGSSMCASTNELLQITYLTKPNLPPGGARAARKLAWEFYQANTGGACSLPDRVTTVNRQGVSWTILDPMDYLTRGLTGLGLVDSWIASVNLKGFTGLTDPLRWLEYVETEVIGCGESFEP